MTLALYFVFCIAVLCACMFCILHLIQKRIDDSRSSSYLPWTAVPAVRTDYWKNLNIVLLKWKISKLWDHDEILYCLESIYINLYMCKVSYTPMLYTCLLVKIWNIIVVCHPRHKFNLNKSRFLLLYPSLLCEKKGKFANSKMIL